MHGERPPPSCTHCEVTARALTAKCTMRARRYLVACVGHCAKSPHTRTFLNGFYSCLNALMKLNAEHYSTRRDAYVPVAVMRMLWCCCLGESSNCGGRRGTHCSEPPRISLAELTDLALMAVFANEIPRIDPVLSGAATCLILAALVLSVFERHREQQPSGCRILKSLRGGGLSAKSEPTPRPVAIPTPQQCSARETSTCSPDVGITPKEAG